MVENHRGSDLKGELQASAYTCTHKCEQQGDHEAGLQPAIFIMATQGDALGYHMLGLQPESNCYMVSTFILKAFVSG
jgi:hypothetical protein